MNPIAIRLLNQQLIAPQYSNPAEVVSFMGAMQAQELADTCQWFVRRNVSYRSAHYIYSFRNDVPYQIS